jgi:hypothetical protein
MLRPRPAGHGSTDGYREVVNGSGSFPTHGAAFVDRAFGDKHYSEIMIICLDRKGLLPADEGANVALLRAFDPVVWERTSELASIPGCGLAKYSNPVLEHCFG